MSQTWQEKARDASVREFLQELDGCKTERERIDKVIELIFMILQAERRIVAGR